ncbi:HET domain containing protein [Hyaloscypha variabilis]
MTPVFTGHIVVTTRGWSPVHSDADPMASKVPHQSSETHIPRGINVCSRCARLAADILSKPLTVESIRSEEIPWQMISGRGERTFSVDYIPKNVRSCALCSLISNEGRWVTFGEADPFLRIEFFVPADGCEPNGFRGTSSVLKGLAETSSPLSEWVSTGGYPTSLPLAASSRVSANWISPKLPGTLNSAASFELAAHWLRDCRENHPSCARKEKIPSLPTRVLDVGFKEDENVSLFISNQKKAEYVALTYCWGKGQTLVTTKESIQAHQKGIALTALPKTLRHAVIITRMLGVRYLWIDSLCIIQDDADDWRKESALMADVYGNNLFAISALSAGSSNDGILSKGVPPEQPLAVVYDDGSHLIGVRKRSPLFRKVMSTAPLNTRGWTFQERLLTPALLHFSDEQIFWECRSQLCYQNGESRSVNPVMKEIYDVAAVAVDLPGVYDEVGRHAPRESLWYSAIQSYSQRSLTVVSDGLHAVAGLKNYLRPNSEHLYGFGLWKDQLHRGLLWGERMGPDGSGMRIGELGPSWTWIAAGWPIGYGRIGKKRYPTEFDLVIEDADVQSDTWTGTLRVQGLLQEVFPDDDYFTTKFWVKPTGDILKMDTLMQYDYHLHKALESWPQKLIVPKRGIIDQKHAEEVVRDAATNKPWHRLWRLRVANWQLDDQYEEGHEWYLLVRQTEYDSETYERVGIGSQHRSMNGRIDKNYTSWVGATRRNLTLS